MPSGKSLSVLKQQQRQQRRKRGVCRISCNPERVCLRRVYFLNKEHSKYLSLGFYPERNYLPCVEFGAPRQTPVVLTSYFVYTLTVHLPKLCENMRNKEPYKCHELLFKLQTCGDDCAKLSFDGSAITLKMAELNYLLLNMGTIESQLARYSLAHNDVIEYVNLTNATNADTFVQPKNGACNFVLYDILFEELQNNTL